jgi:hypothetical protein
VDRNTQISLIPMEDGRDPAKLAAEYGKMLRAAGTAPDKTKRYLAFREAHWQGRAAGQKLGDEFNAAGKAAADQLAAFTHTYKTSWEAWHTSREAARLYVQLGDTTSAINTLAILAGPPGKSLDLLPIEMKQDALVQLAGYSFRAGKVAEAKLVIEELSKDARLELPGLKERLAILIEVSKAPEPVEPKEGEPRIKPTEVIEKTRAAIARAKEPGARALGFNLLGDLYLAHKFPREAMYEYLWVDVVYNQDKDELIKAVSRVIDCFRLIGDEERAKQFEERLQKVR